MLGGVQNIMQKVMFIVLSQDIDLENKLILWLFSFLYMYLIHTIKTEAFRTAAKGTEVIWLMTIATAEVTR